MLEDSGKDYLRLGNEASCDPRYAHRLLSAAFTDSTKLGDIRQRLKDVPILVTTTSALQGRPFLLALKHFSLCIVDEASQILEPNIIGLLSSDSINRFILIGDHKQLPAVVQQADDEPRLHSCRLSLFERLLRQEQEAGREAFTGILDHQGRMHPEVAAFPNEHFYRREQLQTVPCPHQLEEKLDYQLPSQDALDRQLKQHRVMFLPSTDEAVQVADLLRQGFGYHYFLPFTITERMNHSPPQVFYAHQPDGLTHYLFVFIVQSSPETSVRRTTHTHQFLDGHILHIRLFRQHNTDDTASLLIG